MRGEAGAWAGAGGAVGGAIGIPAGAVAYAGVGFLAYAVHSAIDGAAAPSCLPERALD